MPGEFDRVAACAHDPHLVLVAGKAARSRRAPADEAPTEAAYGKSWRSACSARSRHWRATSKKPSLSWVSWVLLACCSASFARARYRSALVMNLSHNWPLTGSNPAIRGQNAAVPQSQPKRTYCEQRTNSVQRGGVGNPGAGHGGRQGRVAGPAKARHKERNNVSASPAYR
jgi:hypothetical protein